MYCLQDMQRYWARDRPVLNALIEVDTTRILLTMFTAQKLE